MTKQEKKLLDNILGKGWETKRVVQQSDTEIGAVSEFAKQEIERLNTRIAELELLLLNPSQQADAARKEGFEAARERVIIFYKSENNPPKYPTYQSYLDSLTKG